MVGYEVCDKTTRRTRLLLLDFDHFDYGLHHNSARRTSNARLSTGRLVSLANHPQLSSRNRNISRHPPRWSTFNSRHASSEWLVALIRLLDGSSPDRINQFHRGCHPLSSPRHLPHAFVMSSSSPSFHCSRLPLYLLIAASISAAPIPQLVNANAFAAQGGITYRLGDAVPTNLPIPPAVFSVVSALPIASALPSRTAPLTLPNVPTPTKIVGPASPISTPSVVQKTVVVVATITVAPSLPTPAPTGAAAASGSTWSLASNFGSDLPNELGVLTWEWGQKNVVVLPGVPAAAWATQTAMAITVAPPASLPTASPVLQLNASTVVPAPILVPAVHAVMAAPRQFDLTNSTVMQVLFPNGSINPANKNAPVGGTGMYMTPSTSPSSSSSISY